MKRFSCIILSVALLSACSTEEAKEPTVITEDVQLESEMMDNSLQYEQGKSILLPPEVDTNFIRGETAFFIKDEQTWKMNIHTQKPTLASKLPVRNISTSGKVGLAYNNEDTDSVEVTAVHFDKNTTLNLGILDTFSLTFLQNELIGSILYDKKTEKSSLAIVDTLSGQRLEHGLPAPVSNRIIANSLNEYYAEVSEPYFAHFDKNGDKTLLLEDVTFFDGEILPNGNIVFDGNVKDQMGVFYYNTKERKLSIIAAGGTSEIGQWVPFFSVSPDGSLIAIEQTSKVDEENERHYRNISVAALTDNGIGHASRIATDVSMTGTTWHDNTLYIITDQPDGKVELLPFTF